MLDWLKNISKEYPEFWKNYLSKFDKKSNRYVILFTETTGVNPKKDVILSLGAVAVVNDNIIIGDSFEVAIPQYRYLHDNGISHDYLLDSDQPKMAEPAAIEQFINYLGNSTLVGHRIHLYVEMINEDLEKLACGRLKNEALDIEIMYKKLHDINSGNFSIDELSRIFKIEQTERISSSDEAYTMALLFLKLKSRLGLK